VYPVFTCETVRLWERLITFGKEIYV
jgi:hypothetical protein